MLKKLGIAMLIVTGLGMSVTTNKSKIGKVQKTVKESNQANTKLSSEDKEAINTAINFMNEYIEIRDPDELDKWLAKAPITEKFRKEYRRREKHIELSQKALEGKLSPADEKFLKENDDINYDYDALLGSGIEEEFIVNGTKNYQGGTEIMLKLVKQNGKWLIDESK